MIFVSLPLYLSKIGNKGKILRKKTKMYEAITQDDVKPRVGITFHATYPCMIHKTVNTTIRNIFYTFLKLLFLNTKNHMQGCPLLLALI